MPRRRRPQAAVRGFTPSMKVRTARHAARLAQAGACRTAESRFAWCWKLSAYAVPSGPAEVGRKTCGFGQANACGARANEYCVPGIAPGVPEIAAARQRIGGKFPTIGGDEEGPSVVSSSAAQAVRSHAVRRSPSRRQVDAPLRCCQDCVRSAPHAARAHPCPRRLCLLRSARGLGKLPATLIAAPWRS